ncbi:protease [Roseococcus sp. SYP-B2431]|uniref:HdeD family acid-resistance protein n=1 Tax=Roseococcus sp. SYP-B2431 TaxID=2496640 RepID=UPI001039E4B2|nr:protease [Roseococcus sp. SYP-B2431]TCH97153.1 protease [Roseococcus sp. SYP-B2431]
MIRLALLLTGATALRARWPALMAAGVAACGLGLLILLDTSDGATVVATHAFGYILVLSGALGLLGTLSPQIRANRMVLVRAGGLLVLGLLIVDLPWNNQIANSLLFGLAFLIDAVLRIAGAWVLRFRRWRVAIAGGLVEAGLAMLAISNWPLSYHLTVPFAIALLLIMNGITLARMGLALRRLPPDASILSIPGFGPPGWYEHLEEVRAVGLPEMSGRPAMVVRIWTPTGSAEIATRRPVVDRYIAAVDKSGKISSGHAVLDFAPHLYISHYPAEETERAAAGFLQQLRATAENDVPGRFLDSYRYEVDTWFPADAHIAFRRFNAARLLIHWAHYSRDRTYNFTRRNCSVAVAVALDAALEGMGGSGPLWRRLPRLLLNPDLWVAAALRRRAETLTWTPMLVYDYARALRRVVEPHQMGWLGRLRSAWMRWRAHRRVERAA